MRAAVDYTATPLEVIDLGNNKTVSLLEMVNALEEALGVKAKLEFLPSQLWDVPQTWADVEKGRKLLNFSQPIPFGEGLRRFSEWLDHAVTS